MALIKKIMASLLLSDKDYERQVMFKSNSAKAFLTSNICKFNQLPKDVFSQPMVISGGTDEERAGILYATIRNTKDMCIIIHRNNNYFNVHELKRRRFLVEELKFQISPYMSRLDIIELLTNEECSHYSYFINYALDVLESLGKELSIEAILKINWFSLEWQAEVSKLQSNVAYELLSRFDDKMAELAPQVLLYLKSITRQLQCDDCYISQTIQSSKLWVFNAGYCTQKQLKHLTTLLQDKFDRLIFDNVILDELPILNSDKVIISSSDITTNSCNYQKILSSHKLLFLFSHNLGSSKQLSECCFGVYDKYVSEYGISMNEGVFSKNNSNKSINYRVTKEQRLDPSYIANLNLFQAVFYSRHLGEGIIDVKGEIEC